MPSTIVPAVVDQHLAAGLSLEECARLIRVSPPQLERDLKKRGIDHRPFKMKLRGKTIAPDVRVAAIEMFAAGRTVKDVWVSLDISYSSVMSIKKRAGLVTQKKERCGVGCGRIIGPYWHDLKAKWVYNRKEDWDTLATSEHAWSLFQSQDGSCHFCGMGLVLPLTYDDVSLGRFTSSIDRIDNALGHVNGNIQWTCILCNRFRYTDTVEEYVQRCRRVSITHPQGRGRVPFQPTGLAVEPTKGFRSWWLKKINGWVMAHREDPNAIVSLDKVWGMLRSQGERCYFCDVGLIVPTTKQDPIGPRGASLDRFDNRRYHSEDNSLWTCVACNTGRIRYKDTDYVTKCHMVAKYQE